MIQKPKGTKDILPTETYRWNYVEDIAKTSFERAGFKEIRVPTFEYTELFERGVGETTDVVQKEMYTFEDKGKRSITLRPEGTAGVVRAYIENGLSSATNPLKVWYKMPMFRYENVQKGRYREFNQIGLEIIGSKSYLADVEAISIAQNFLNNLNIKNIILNINSIGCPKCRENYQKQIKEFVGRNLEQYCDTCKTRFEKNPMRILDCKEKRCKELNINAPVILDYLCEECKTHFENVKSMLENLNIQYKIDPSIVRGLDYYTKTVFEFISKDDGLTILAGGRYDGLVKELGGQDTPAVGLAAGEERILSLIEREEIQDVPVDIYIAPMSSNEIFKAIEITTELRKYISAETDVLERSFNAQLKYANKINAKYLIVIGENEIKKNTIKLKDMKTGEEKVAKLDIKDILEKINE